MRDFVIIKPQAIKPQRNQSHTHSVP